jgi:hypothetical protein
MDGKQLQTLQEALELLTLAVVVEPFGTHLIHILVDQV